MNHRERVLAALNWEAVDVVPFVPKPNHVPRDPVKLKKLKGMGMGLSVPVNVFQVETPRVKTEAKDIGNNRTRILHTPEGDVYEKVRIDLPSEGDRSVRF